ncbi:hypothetical protein EON66_00975 [archaeon]|nr:MAG: hypothetical protein EON66_00975 [archaeon]
MCETPRGSTFARQTRASNATQRAASGEPDTLNLLSSDDDAVPHARHHTGSAATSHTSQVCGGTQASTSTVGFEAPSLPHRHTPASVSSGVQTRACPAPDSDSDDVCVSELLAQARQARRQRGEAGVRTPAQYASSTPEGADAPHSKRRRKMALLVDDEMRTPRSSTPSPSPPSAHRGGVKGNLSAWLSTRSSQPSACSSTSTMSGSLGGASTRVQNAHVGRDTKLASGQAGGKATSVGVGKFSLQAAPVRSGGGGMDMPATVGSSRMLAFVPPVLSVHRSDASGKAASTTTVNARGGALRSASAAACAMNVRAEVPLTCGNAAAAGMADDDFYWDHLPDSLDWNSTNTSSEPQAASQSMQPAWRALHTSVFSVAPGEGVGSLATLRSATAAPPQHMHTSAATAAAVSDTSALTTRCTSVPASIAQATEHAMHAPIQLRPPPVSRAVGRTGSEVGARTSARDEAARGVATPWIEKYAPQTVADLAWHKKKVVELQTWMHAALATTVSNSHGTASGMLPSTPRLLIVFGPTGAGKSTAGSSPP